MVKMDSELFHAACDIMRTRDAQLAALGDDELMHDGRKGMKWGKNIFTEDEEKKRREGVSSGQSQYAQQLQAEANRRRYGGSAYNDPKPERPPTPAASRLPEEPEPISGLEKRFDNSASAKADYYRNKYGSQSSSSTTDDVENGRRIREQQRAQREAAAKYGGPAYTPSQKDLDKLNEDNRRSKAEKQIERANAMRRNGINGQSEEQKNLDDATRIAREKGKTVLYDQHGGTKYDPHGLPVDMYVKTNSVTPEGIKTSTYGSTTFDLENPENLSTKFARKEAREYGDMVTNNEEINRKKREDLERQKTNAQAAIDRANQLRDARTNDRNVIVDEQRGDNTRDVTYMTPKGDRVTKSYGPAKEKKDPRAVATEAMDRANQIRDAREHDRNVLSSDKYSDSGIGWYDTHDISYTSPSGNRITKSIPRESGDYEHQGRQGHMNIMNARGENLQKLLKNIDIWKQKKK